MGNKNYLRGAFSWTADTVDAANPAIFKLLAVLLPYLTPMPVAILTAQSAGQFLGMNGRSAGILVFSLEGLGILFTSLFVESVVDYIKGKIRSLVLPIIFGIVVAIYIYILVAINVTLHDTVGDQTDAISRVITLLCFLPFLSGIGSGYHRLKIKDETEATQAAADELARQRLLEDTLFERNQIDKDAEHRRQLELLAIQAEQDRLAKESEFNLSQAAAREETENKLRLLEAKRQLAREVQSLPVQEVVPSSRPAREAQGKGPSPRDLAYMSIEKFHSVEGRAPTNKELVQLGHDKSTASRALTLWFQNNPRSK